MVMKNIREKIENLLDRLKDTQLYFIMYQTYLFIVRKRYKCPFKPYTLVKFNYDNLNEEFHNYYLKIFKKDTIYVFFGEISNKPQHCIVCDYETGQIICGYDTDNFVELTDDEI